MKTISASEANRKFSALLKQVSKGEKFTVVSRGKPVARIISVKDENARREAAKNALLSRLQAQEVTGERDWTRSELYSR